MSRTQEITFALRENCGRRTRTSTTTTSAMKGGVHLLATLARVRSIRDNSRIKRLHVRLIEAANLPAADLGVRRTLCGSHINRME